MRRAHPLVIVLLLTSFATARSAPADGPDREAPVGVRAADRPGRLAQTDGGASAGRELRILVPPRGTRTLVLTGG